MRTAWTVVCRIVECISAILAAVARDGYAVQYGDRTTDASEGRR